MFAETLTNRVLAYADRHSVGSEPFLTEIPGMNVVRHFSPTDLAPVLYRPIFCLVLQGAKQTYLGGEVITFAQRHSVIVGLELPTFARVVEASSERPYVALALHIDMTLIKELAAEIDDLGCDEERASAIAAGEADDAVVDAMERLFGLLDKPNAMPILRPLLLREIHFWLLSATHGSLLRQLGRTNSHAARMSEAIVHIRRNYTEPLRIPDLARTVGMSESGFHQHFKAVCGTTPLQFQKRLRLLEARRLMISRDYSVSSVADAVGYESPTQFSREFTRMFGLPPREHRRSFAPGCHEGVDPDMASTWRASSPRLTASRHFKADARYGFLRIASSTQGATGTRPADARSVPMHHQEEAAMGIEQAPTEKGRQAARGFKQETRKEEKKVEAEKGSDLAKGADRFEERSKSSDGKSAGAKQR